MSYSARTGFYAPCSTTPGGCTGRSNDDTVAHLECMLPFACCVHDERLIKFAKRFKSATNGRRSTHGYLPELVLRQRKTRPVGIRVKLAAVGDNEAAVGTRCAACQPQGCSPVKYRHSGLLRPGIPV